jgi:hypothetical protein
MASSTTTVFHDVALRGKKGGSLELNSTRMIYIPADPMDSAKAKVIWRLLKSYQKHSKKPMLKLTNQQDKVIVFQLPNRAELERLQAEVSQRMQALKRRSSVQIALEDSCSMLQSSASNMGFSKL